MKLAIVCIIFAVFLVQIGVSFGEDFIVIGSDGENDGGSMFLVDTFWIEMCQESWSCTAWSGCLLNTHTRTCTDANSCGTTLAKPATTEDCVIPSPIPSGHPADPPVNETNQTEQPTTTQSGGIDTTALLVAISVIGMFMFIGFVGLNKKLPGRAK